MQATLGPKSEEIERVCEIGFSAWLDEQFATPQSITHHEVFEARVAGCTTRCTTLGGGRS